MEPGTALAIAKAIEAAGKIGGELVGGGGGDPAKTVNFEAWAEILNSMRGQRATFGERTTDLYGQNLGAINQALSGQMGLSPEMMKMMSGRLNRSLDPSFAMGRDELRRSFSPRMAGSGAAGASMGQLLGQQSQARSSGQADIQIQDLFARHQGQMAGLGQMGQMYGMNQGALMNLLAQIAGHTRTQTQGFMG